MSYIVQDSSDDNSKIQALIDSGATPRLVELLKCYSASVPVRVCVYHRNVMCVMYGIALCLSLYSHSDKNVTGPALRAVGNLVTGNDNQVTDHTITR